MSSPAQQSSNTPGPSGGGDSRQQTPQQTPQTPTSGDQQRALSNLPSQADLDKIVASYLQKKGYKATEATFLKELGGNTVTFEEIMQELASAGKSVPSHILKYKDADSDPDAYSVSYRNLREWIENSLDWYKVTQLTAILNAFWPRRC